MVHTYGNEHNAWLGGQAIRLLIVDGSPQDMWLIQRMVNMHRLRAHEIWTASTGQDGLELFAVARPDCILLDYLLPDMTGLDFLDQLAMPDRTLPTAVVMLTATTDTNVIVEAMKRGSLDCISKSGLSTEQLHRAISNAMEKAKLRIQLRRRHDELAQFMNQASHKVRIPLRTALRNVNALYTLSEKSNLAEIRMDNSPSLQQRLDALYDAISVAENLLTSVDTYSQFIRHLGPLVQVDMQNLAETILTNLYKPIEQAGATVTIDPLPTLLGDKDSLYRLLHNLIQNSLEHPGDVPLRITVSAAPRGHHWQIIVADNGTGIQANVLHRIFEPFYRPNLVADDRKAGLGLAICAHIVEHHGGSIWLNSKIGRGTNVHFTLPQIGYRPAIDLAARPLGEEWKAVTKT